MENTEKTVIRRILSPVESFMAMETSGGIVLIFCTMAAMILANSAWEEAYHHFIHLKFGLTIGDIQIEKSLLHWVNDGLMAIFFFVVGLEIKRELVFGELSTPRKAALPMFAAVGGMVVPALIYVYFNQQPPQSAGWGIPMATDIAFAVGIISILGKRVPFSLKVFLLALAIVDDLGAVLVIAFFYTESISGQAIGVASAVMILTFICKRTGVRHLLVYVILGIAAWSSVLASGIHATIAGVLLGFMTPVTAWYRKETLVSRIPELSQRLINALKDSKIEHIHELPPKAKADLHELHDLSNEAEAPLERLIHILHPWVTFIVMPVFAFVNAGVSVHGLGILELFQENLSLGIILGLFVGKPLGIGIASWLAIRLNLGQLPQGVTWTHIMGAGCLGGIGFTMALFVSNLALGSGELEIYSKLGILTASVLSAVVGILLLVFAKPASERPSSATA